MKIISLYICLNDSIAINQGNARMEYFSLMYTQTHTSTFTCTYTCICTYLAKLIEQRCLLLDFIAIKHILAYGIFHVRESFVVSWLPLSRNQIEIENSIPFTSAQQQHGKHVFVRLYVCVCVCLCMFVHL